jgi:cell division protein FtsI/penicillin-binding protein 2
VSYAPAFKPEISVVALIENAGLGSRFGAPAVRAMYDVYYAKTRGTKETSDNIAMKTQ